MKVVALNIRHGGGRRITGIVDYLRSQSGDVVVLTEFRENSNAHALRLALAADGFSHFAAASSSAHENSVCIFAAQPFVPRTYPGLSTGYGHRVVSALLENFAIVGVYFPQSHAKAALFQFLIGGGLGIETAHIVVGDFNTGLHGLDEAGHTFHCAEDFAALSSAGLVDCWRSRNPGAKEFSWYSNAGNGFRIDHAFASPAANDGIRHIYYDHVPRESKVTDHSALVMHADYPDVLAEARLTEKLGNGAQPA